MANPVALDLSAAKTLFAFGERAAKHGLVIPADLQQFIDEPEKMARLVEYAKAGAPEIVSALPEINWELVYEKLGMQTEFRGLAVSNPCNNNSSPNLWFIPMLKGVTCNKIVSAMQALDVNFYLYANDLDKAVPTNDRDPNRDGSYVIGFAKTVEADEKNKNLSANQLKEQNHKGITLMERLLLEPGYFLATGKHLDEKSATLCSGSRDSDGSVPYVCWGSDVRGVDVDWYDPGIRHDHLRSRSAVSLPA